MCEAGKQSRITCEIAALPSIARNDSGTILSALALSIQTFISQEIVTRVSTDAKSEIVRIDTTSFEDIFIILSENCFNARSPVRRTIAPLYFYTWIRRLKDIDEAFRAHLRASENVFLLMFRTYTFDLIEKRRDREYRAGVINREDNIFAFRRLNRGILICEGGEREKEYILNVCLDD